MVQKFASLSVYDDAYEKAMQLKEEHNYTFVHPFDDEDVIAGQVLLVLNY